jgi:BMFP domain-containing protein YqiC
MSKIYSVKLPANNDQLILRRLREENEKLRKRIRELEDDLEEAEKRHRSTDR